MSHHAGVVFFSDQNLYGVFRWEIRSSKAYRMVRTRLQPLGVAVYDANRINGQSVEFSVYFCNCTSCLIQGQMSVPLPMGDVLICVFLCQWGDGVFVCKTM